MVGDWLPKLWYAHMTEYSAAIKNHGIVQAFPNGTTKILSLIFLCGGELFCTYRMLAAFQASTH